MQRCGFPCEPDLSILKESENYGLWTDLDKETLLKTVDASTLDDECCRKHAMAIMILFKS